MSCRCPLLAPLLDRTLRSHLCVGGVHHPLGSGCRIGRGRRATIACHTGLVIHNFPVVARWLTRRGARERRSRLPRRVGRLSQGAARGVAEARDRRDEARKLLSVGQDPALAKKEAKLARQQVVNNSFEILAREWHQKELPRWSGGHAERVIESLEADVFPWIGGLPVHNLTAPVILATVKKVEERGAVDTAQRLLQRISAVMKFAIQTGRGQVNPCPDILGALRAPKVEHRPALPRAELPEFFKRLEAEPVHPQTRMAMHLLMYTFVRPGELRTARWDEFDIENALWRLPAEKMKMRVPHIVPLAGQVLDLLSRLKEYSGRNQWLFPGMQNHERPMCENTLSYAMGRMGYKSVATPHGFRALASTVLNEEGFRPDVIERQLAHAERNKVRAAYHRAEYLEDRRRMMQWWADFLDGNQG